MDGRYAAGRRAALPMFGGAAACTRGGSPRGPDQLHEDGPVRRPLYGSHLTCFRGCGRTTICRDAMGECPDGSRRSGRDVQRFSETGRKRAPARLSLRASGGRIVEHDHSTCRYPARASVAEKIDCRGIGLAAKPGGYSRGDTWFEGTVRPRGRPAKGPCTLVGGPIPM